MNVKQRLPAMALITVIILLIGIYGLNWYKQNAIKTLTLNFTAVVGDQPLVFNQLNYPNPGGPGLFKVREFLFYISNIKLISADGEYVEPDSYHLARFDNDTTSYAISLNNIPNRDYQTIEFSIGVDETANGTLTSKGDLDPNSRMAWSWDVGYKFILFEGGLAHDNTLYPLVYHVGFDENYRTIRNDLPQSVFEETQASVQFKVDIMKLFNGKANLNMIELPSIKFDKEDTRFLADNYQHMFTPKQ
ncbi:MAG: hypothetical protein MJK04_02680 [Psychrosphaera sp.]|nr:hypothetical protein [Psychrosphaera sp.]